MKAMTVSHKQPAVSAQGRHSPNSPHARRRRPPHPLGRLGGTQEGQSPQVPGRQSAQQTLGHLTPKQLPVRPPPARPATHPTSLAEGFMRLSPFRAVILFREPKSFRSAPNTRDLARYLPTSHSRPSVAPGAVRDPNSASVLVTRKLSRHPQKTRDFPL